MSNEWENDTGICDTCGDDVEPEDDHCERCCSLFSHVDCCESCCFLNDDEQDLTNI